MKDYSLYHLLKRISFVSDLFELNLKRALNLVKVNAPIIVANNKGINDDLNNVEKPVTFKIPKYDLSGEIVQSLAKWKRLALKKYDVPLHHGIVALLKAVRKDELLSHMHSFYVDQFEWEVNILEAERNLTTLKNVVKKIYEVIYYVAKQVHQKYFSNQSFDLPDEIHFISSQQLLEMYPDSTPKEREDLITKEYKAVFIIGIGDPLTDAIPHDLRAPDYDDWKLNGDILVYNQHLDCGYELSSMGIRVNKASLLRQLDQLDLNERKDLYFHNLVLQDDLPFSIGGGIGISRLAMWYLQVDHIGQVQPSMWPEDILVDCAKKGIELL